MKAVALDFPKTRTRQRSAWLEAGVTVASLALAGFVLAQPYHVLNLFVVTVAVAALAGWIVVQDLKTLTIADGAVVSIVGLALAYRCSSGDAALDIGLDCLLTGGVLLALREIYYARRGFDGLGLGDVKLAGAGGLLVGATTFASALLVASLLGLGFVAGRRFVGRVGDDLSDRLAFGAILAPTVWAAFVMQHYVTYMAVVPPFTGP